MARPTTRTPLLVLASLLPAVLGCGTAAHAAGPAATSMRVTWVIATPPSPAGVAAGPAAWAAVPQPRAMGSRDASTSSGVRAVGRVMTGLPGVDRGADTAPLPSAPGSHHRADVFLPPRPGRSPRSGPRVYSDHQLATDPVARRASAMDHPPPADAVTVWLEHLKAGGG